MRHAPTVILFAIFLLQTSCLQSRKEPQPETSAPSVAPASSLNPAAPARKDTIAAVAAVTAVPMERRIIHTAELTLQLGSPADGKHKIEAIANSHGGFVVSSEISAGDESEVRIMVTVIVRVPAASFLSTLEEIRKLGYKIMREKITGQDVTEESIDLEARLKAKRAVEAQFLEIMKQARQVSDALEVQKALGEVRGEIEQLEGRRRFLENQVSLSTLTITLQTPAAVMSTSAPGFFLGLRRAFGEGSDAALEVILWLIRFALVMLPIMLFVILPALYLWRRLRRKKA